MNEPKIGDEVVRGDSIVIMKVTDIMDGIAICEWKERGQTKCEQFPMSQLQRKQENDGPTLTGRDSIPNRIDPERRHFKPQS